MPNLLISKKICVIHEYIPWGVWDIGLYADTKRVKPSEIPGLVSDLWDRKWKGRISLNIAKPWYNIGLVLMS